MKKNYFKPTVKVVKTRPMHLLQASGAKYLRNNVNLNLGGKSNVAGRGREAEFDDGEWSEE